MTVNKKSFFHRLRGDTSGSVMILIGATFFAMVAILGFAIDYTRVQMVQDRLQSALDAAALAGTKQASFMGGEIGPALSAARMFRANFPADYMGTSNVQITSVSQIAPLVPLVGVGMRYEVRNASIPTYVMRVFGINTVEVSAVAEVQSRPIEPQEVVFSIDVSGSMPWDDGTGCTTGCGPAHFSQNTGDFSRIGKAKQAMGWLAGLFLSASTPGSIAFSVVPWDFRVNAAPALTGGGGACFAGNQNRGDHCIVSPQPLAPVLHLSDNVGAVVSYIDNLIVADGPHSRNTDSSSGMFWALAQFGKSPLAGFGDWIGWRHGGNTASPIANRVIVLISDGFNTASYTQGLDGGMSSAQQDVSYDEMVNICNFSKSLGIRIFTVVYNYPAFPYREPFTRCATNADHYFEAPNGVELQRVLEVIGRQLMMLRLTR